MQYLLPEDAHNFRQLQASLLQLSLLRQEHIQAILTARMEASSSPQDPQWALLVHCLLLQVFPSIPLPEQSTSPPVCPAHTRSLTVYLHQADVPNTPTPQRSLSPVYQPQRYLTLAVLSARQ